MILREDQASRISPDGLIHDAERLKELQAMPLHRKIGISSARIIEWYQHWNGKVFDMCNEIMPGMYRYG